MLFFFFKEKLVIDSGFVIVFKMASFVSANELAKQRFAKKKLQSDALASAKTNFEKQQNYLQRKKEIKEDKWMASGLESRLKADDITYSSSHKHKKSHKKHKKKEKKRKRESSSEESSAHEWVEKHSKPKQNHEEMDNFLSGLATYTSEDVKEKKKRTNEKINVQTKHLTMFDQPGQHSRELNPFWKSGGDGLPTSESSTAASVVPDVEWLERSLKRMQEQSEDSGRSLESIASERYGSLEAFNSLLDKARQKSGKRTSSHADSRSRRFMKPTDNERPSKRNDKPYSRDATPRWKKQQCPPKEDKAFVSKKSGSLQSFKDEKHKQHLKEEPKQIDSDKPECKPKTTIKQPPKQTELKVLSEEEKNKIGAKIIKAELMGNMSLVEKLKKKLEDSKTAERMLAAPPSDEIRLEHNHEEESDNESSSGSDSEDETVVLMRTTKTGHSWPLTGSEDIVVEKKKRKKKKMIMHDKDGQRERYFADDDRYSLRDLVEQEKSGAAEGNVEVISRLSAKAFTKASGDSFTLDDIFESEAGKISSSSVSNRQRDVTKNRKLMRRLENCKLCFGNPENLKHLIVAAGRVCYLKLPSHKVLQDGHCVIAPMHHSASGTNLDEDVWDEIRKFMQSLCNMFAEEDKDCIFIQTCSRFHSTPHFYMECIPLPIDLGDVAPIYFKKAIQECEGEWSQNKKLVDTRGKSVKDKIPAGLPYFAVDFGLSGGFAHVIEDERQFPDYFGREILGGMLDADPYLWRKPKEESFSDQLKRSIEFEKSYKNFDWTKTEIR